MANKNLTNAKRVKNDEFYTQFGDIQKEIEAYLEYSPDVFRGKVVYCNCDDPFESNFFRYFVLNFNKLGLKQLITTSYKPSPIANTLLDLINYDKTLAKSKGRPKVTANKFIINNVGDMDDDGDFDLQDIAKQLKDNKHKEIKGKKAYDKYDNYNAIEVPFTDAIPSDYSSVMGVPISFLDKYSPEQFEIIGSNRGVDQDLNGIYGKGSHLNGKETFKRLFIRHKKVKK